MKRQDGEVLVPLIFSYCETSSSVQPGMDEMQNMYTYFWYDIPTCIGARRKGGRLMSLPSIAGHSR